MLCSCGSLIDLKRAIYIVCDDKPYRIRELHQIVAGNCFNHHIMKLPNRALGEWLTHIRQVHNELTTNINTIKDMNI